MDIIAPVTDYVPKSTIVFEEFLPVQPVQGAELSEKGVKIDAAGEYCIANTIIKSSLYTLENIWLYADLFNGDPQNIHLIAYWANLGENYSVNSYSEDEFSMDAPGGTGTIMRTDILSYLTDITYNQRLSIRILYSAVATVSNLYIIGLRLLYSLT